MKIVNGYLESPAQVKLPDWTSYVARDADGLVHAFSRKPRRNESYGLWINDAGDSKFLLDLPEGPPEDWKDSLISLYEKVDELVKATRGEQQ